MKIAQTVSLHESVPPQSKNGLEFIVSWLTEELVSRGHDVTLFAPANSTTKAKLFSILPRQTNKDIADYGQPYFNIWNSTMAATMADSFDIFHAHNAESISISPFVKIPFVQTLHHPFSHDFLCRYVESPEHVKYMTPVLDYYAKINYVTVSQRQEEQFSVAESTYFKKHTTIHNGIPTDKFTFSKTPKDYLFYIGYINKNKGADIAVQVAKALDMKLILAGNNYGEEKFFDESIKPYLSDKITYVGPVDFATKNDLYSNAVATLAPIHWEEPFGLVLAESQACGTPVIAFNKGASKEVISHNQTGFVVENKEEMIEAVKKISQIDRKECRTWIEDNFSVKQMADKYESLYQEILSKK